MRVCEKVNDYIDDRIIKPNIVKYTWYPQLMASSEIDDKLQLVDVQGNMLIDRKLDVYEFGNTDKRNASIFILSKKRHKHAYGEDPQYKWLEGVVYCPMCQEYI